MSYFELFQAICAFDGEAKRWGIIYFFYGLGEDYGQDRKGKNGNLVWFSHNLLYKKEFGVPSYTQQAHSQSLHNIKQP